MAPATDPTPTFSCKTSSCIQAQALHPQRGHAKFHFPAPVCGCSRLQEGIMVVALCAAHVAVPQLRAELLKTPPKGWLCCSAQLSLELGSPCLEVTYFIPCMTSCSIPRLRSGIAMQISPLLPQTVIIKSEVVKQAASIFGARPQQHMVIALS